MGVTRTTFDTTVDATLVAAQGAGTYIKVVAISMHNNNTTESDDEIVKLRDGNGGTVLYGGTTGAIYVPGRGGVFQLAMSYDATDIDNHAHFKLSANTALYIDLTNARRISGAVWWTVD
jgi:hypothetical protein